MKKKTLVEDFRKMKMPHGSCLILTKNLKTKNKKTNKKLFNILNKNTHGKNEY